MLREIEREAEKSNAEWVWANMGHGRKILIFS